MSRIPLRRPEMSRLTFLLLFSVYIAVFLNLIFYRQVWVLLPVNSAYTLAVFLSMPLVAFSVINILATLASFLWLERVVVVIFILLSAATQYFIWTYGIIIDRSMIANMLDTTPAESFALMTPQLLLTIGLSGIAMAIFAFVVKFKKSPARVNSLVVRCLNIGASIVLLVLIAAFFYKDYASVFRNNKELIKSLGPSNSISALWSYNIHHRMDNLPLVKLGEDAKRDPAMHTPPNKHLTILIVGETSRGDNFGLSGYDRDTNPLLSKDDVVYFPKTTSCGTATAISVPCMFSGMPRKNYDEQLAHHREGLLDIVQRAGISVLWNENDGGCKGACDRVPHQDMTKLDLADYCIKGECQDDILFHDLQKYINSVPEDGLIVLHTIGSHGPTYYNRYPPQFRKFTPTCDTNEIQTCSREQLVNTYDNTVLYVDYIVDKAIKLLQAQPDNVITSLVYLSDHGESLGENGVYLHGLPYSIAPDAQKHIPMLIWLSRQYQTRHAVDYRCLKKRAATEDFSQDNLFSTMLGLVGVQTSEYHAADDILAPCRG
ncbi:phosphoethanolamine transferase EptA [Enterobacter sp. ENT03]|uniref:phosphoethanolamine transferase EptA n=1 Tax=Enterobacter sp. ENT03 TaxID=2854780 RepID=UPI001C46D835|nr:phosphoethanolamine transferase EptA [Enterobacter sp. ENT03]MBV7403818.1 phosphoethanolamine transferase EptA [Enterobacter sp. ENT03]